MKTYLIVVLVLFSLLCAQKAHGQWGELLEFGAGYLTGHAAHEMGHQLASQAVGLPIKWQMTGEAPSFIKWDSNPKLRDFFSGEKITQEEFDRVMSSPIKKKRDIVGLGGFGAEIISSEIIFATTDLKRSDGSFNYYAIGWTSMTIINPIVYVILDANQETSIKGVGGYGDLGRISTIEKKHIRYALIGHAVLNVIRLGLILDNSTDNVDIYSSVSAESANISFTLKF